jgi:hypothetical protein
MDPKFPLKGHDIKLVDCHKILGLIFDKRLDWLAHINYVKAIASKRVNILKCVSNVRWAADQDSLLRINQMLVLSTPEYGSSAYSSARLRNLKKLDTVHHNDIRIALGAFRYSRIENIMCESGFTTLSHRRERQIANSAVRMMSIKDHQISKHRRQNTV